MKRILLCALVLALATGIQAQQDPQFSQWMYDKLSFNPAVAGTDGANCLNLFYRQQWAGLGDEPQTILFNFHAPIKKNMGWGISFMSDELGQQQNTSVRGHFSYHLPVGATNNKLALGASIGYLGSQLGNDWFPPDTPAEIDDLISENKQNDGSFDMNFGAYFFKPENYYIGASMTHLTGPELKDINIDVVQHYYFMAGYVYEVSSNVKLRPNLLMKSDGNASIFDINANALINDLFWLGVTYRTQDAITPMAGFQYAWDNEDGTMPQSIKLGYSMDLTTSDIKDYSSGSHEIMVTYCFNVIQKIISKQHGNPRFL